MTAPRLLLATGAFALAGCDTIQTALGSDGSDGRAFVTLFWIFTAVCTAMYLLVIGFLAISLIRRRRHGPDAPESSTEVGAPAMKTALIGWIALIVLGLTGLTIGSFFTDRSMAGAAHGKPLLIDVTANQWWWDVQYRSDDAAEIVHTANELHLPVGVPALINLRSNDVIHSFWIPNLAGKQDLIPGRDADATIVPRKIGVYRGQCAEYCGTQHAHMALDVTVESKQDFERWWASQIRPAAPPPTPQALVGFRYVTTRECAMCHNITGTPASGSVGPDLTHLASRRSIAAGTLPMSRGSLYAWVADPQSQKPGNHMPAVGLEPGELHGIVAYLESLK